MFSANNISHARKYLFKEGSLTEDIDLAIRRMRKRRSPRDEDGPHQRMLMVIPMQPAGMIHKAIRLSILSIELVLGDNRPPRLGHDPQRRNAVVVCKVIALRHVDVAEVDVKVGVGLGLFHQPFVHAL